MAVCSWCDGEMTAAISCTVNAFHRNGRRFLMVPFGDEPGRPMSGDQCGDCGTVRGGWHHPGCDMQPCPACGRQLISCGCRFDEDGPDVGLSLAEPLGVDGNGVLTERMWIGDQEVIIHRDDVPESDVTTIDGIRCTTALRTVIDVAPDIEASHLAEIVRDCLERGLFTVEEAIASPRRARHGRTERCRTAACFGVEPTRGVITMASVKTPANFSTVPKMAPMRSVPAATYSGDFGLRADGRRHGGPCPRCG